MTRRIVGYGLLAQSAGADAIFNCLTPTARLITRHAARTGQHHALSRYLVEGAFDLLVSGDAEAHDRMVANEVHRAVSTNDVVVLAQASMARLLPKLAQGLPVPVLSSPRLGIEALKQRLFPGPAAQARSCETRSAPTAPQAS